MSAPSRIPPQARRRSSVAYDPARDTFTEIPTTVPEDVVVDRSQPNTSSPAQEQGVKRKRPIVEDDDDPQHGETNGVHESHQQLSPPAQSKTDTTLSQTNSSSSELKPAPKSALDLPRVPRRPREEGEAHAPRRAPDVYSRRPDAGRPRQNGSRGSRSPERRPRDDFYRRRSPPKRQRPRSPSPIRRSPPRGDFVRPGGARGRGRNLLAEQQRLAAEREQARQVNPAAGRGVQAMSNQFYNQRPEWVKERGRDWRKNESQIKGLRSYNNWIKSCIIHKFSPEEKAEEEELGWGEEAKAPEEQKPLLVLDIGCGKGGDLGKWDLAPQPVALYVGLDPAETSIEQASDRYRQMGRNRRPPNFEGHFVTKDCFGDSIGDIKVIRDVGFDPNAGTGQISKFSGGGFDIVTMMFSMHYAFESEDKVKTMLRNVAGSLKKGGRFIGVAPNSDSLAESIKQWYRDKPDTAAVQSATKPDGEAPSEDEGPAWGNNIYNVRFPPSATLPLTPDAKGEVNFRPPVGWKYTYWMAEAVDVPEFVVPWEAFRAIAEGYNLEQRYRKGFLDIWETEKGNKELFSLGERMGVVDRDGSGRMRMSEEEKEAVGFYHAFCFVKV